MNDYVRGIIYLLWIMPIITMGLCLAYPAIKKAFKMRKYKKLSYEEMAAYRIYGLRCLGQLKQEVCQ